MSVSVQTPYQKYTGNGMSTVFALPFGGDKQENILVSVDGLTQAYGVNYTVTALSESSGEITFAVAPGDGLEVIAWRETPIERPDDYAEHGVLPASGLNADLDRMALIVQENAARYDRLLDAVPDIGSVLDNIEDVKAAADLVLTRVVDTVEDLKDLLHGEDQYAHVLGYHEPGDGGGGLYFYDGTDLTSDDNLGTVIVAGDGARWKLQVVDYLSVKQFGAMGNDDNDDQPAIQAAITWIKDSGTKVRRLRVPLGVYRLVSAVSATAHLELNNVVGLSIEGDGCMWGTVFKAMSTDLTLLDVRGSSISCRLENLSFDRDYAEIGDYRVSKALTGAHGIHFYGSWSNPGFWCENVIVTHHDCGIKTSSARMLAATWTGCHFNENRRHGAHLIMNNEDRFIACLANMNGWYASAGGARVKETLHADGVTTEYGAGWRIGDANKTNGAASVGGVYLDSCTTWNNAGHGVHIEGADNGVYPASAIQICNGFFDSSNLSGIFIQFAWGVHIASTKLSWNDQRGIHIGFGAQEVTVAGCVAHDNVNEGYLVYGSAKNVTFSGCQAISNDRDTTAHAYGWRIAGPCEDIHIIGGASGNGSAVLTNGESPGTDPLGALDYTITRNCQYGGIRIEKYAGADSPRQIYIRDVSFPDMDAARLVTYSSGSGLEVGNEIYCDVGRDWTPIITDSASTPAEITAYTVDRAKYWRSGADKVELTLLFTITDDGGKTGSIGVSLPVTSDWQAGPLPAFNHGTGVSLVGLPYGAGMWIQASGGGNIIGEHTYAVGGSYSLTVVT